MTELEETQFDFPFFKGRREMKCGLGLTATIGGSKLYKPSAVAVLFAVVAFVYQILSSNVVQASLGLSYTDLRY